MVTNQGLKWLSGASIASVLLASPLAFADTPTYPDKPITLVVPYAPGGGTDVLARVLGEALSEDLQQPVIVENKPGGGTTIGTSYVARSKADGYTLLLAPPAYLINPSLRSDISYDTLKDFDPITSIAITPLIMVVNPAIEANDLKGFIDYAQKNGETLNYGTPGVGSSPHLAAELLKTTLGIDMVHIPYKGSAQATTDLVRGEISMSIDVMMLYLEHIEAGNVKPLAVTTSERASLLPDVPTVAESGYPEFEAVAWYGIVAPAGTPSQAVERLNDALINVLQKGEIKEKYKDLAFTPSYESPTKAQDRIEQEVSKWGKVVKKADIHLD